MTLPQAPRAIVVDASVAVPFLDGDAAMAALWEAWARNGAILLAPVHFSQEVANALLLGKRLPAADVQNRMARLATSGVQTSDRGLPGLHETIELAERHRLTIYDAAYLQIALEVEAEVATQDRDLANAATREGLVVV